VIDCLVLFIYMHGTNIKQELQRDSIVQQQQQISKDFAGEGAMNKDPLTLTVSFGDRQHLRQSI